MSENIVHVVQPGECMSSIADRYGFCWRTLWALPENSALKNKRKNPNVLMERDEVVIPAKRVKLESGATEAHHRFVRKGVPSRFRMCLLVAGKPRADVPYTCAVERKLISSRTDADGIVSFPIPPGAQRGLLRVGIADDVEEYEISFGQLDPIEEVTGIQQRLKNLGYECEVTGELDEETLRALAAFRADQDLPESDSVDDATRGALANAHGS